MNAARMYVCMYISPSRHGLELSNRDLMVLEHLPAMPHKGWALHPGVPPPSSATAHQPAAS